ncbi:hypothetical protein BC962_0406 [Gillisia mitskevichiae]|uniref:Outer membrane protein with beta-barrel domain n=1 Tax=Gillisia mitskevichiae TaxID=270921 RepID=A0A495PYH1_9FLAO|nr:hypothetical protein [Gillisia mitskevichiae]RKS55443.1 hypothetical protein BC962_0406 [Gillisia mitskevichiae]
MEERKHIDRVFQEKFKDFEATPRDVVWDNISTRLNKNNRKNRILPLWYKIAGVAAVLALFINYASGLFKNTAANSPTISTLVNTDSLNISLASQQYTQNMIRSSIILKTIIEDTKNKEEDELKENSILNTSNNEINQRNIKVISMVTSDKYSFSNYEESIVNTTPKEDAANKTNLENKKDLPIPSLIAENESLAENTLSPKKLRVSTMAAPVYYDNFGSGTSIDSQFKNNESSGEISIAYGINLAYQISEKIKIRSGISKVDLSYNTKNIAFTAAVNPTALSSINYSDGNIPNYRIENRTVRQFSNLTASSEFNRASLAAPTAGYLNQKLGFIEVPLEIEYVIIDKKIGLNIIGGGSTLFLNNNMISLNSTDFSTNLGKANNLNNVSFTTNLGVGVDYNISPQFQLNLEPIFKYQINTFSNTTGNVNPYYFGVYSGFSFKF